MKKILIINGNPSAGAGKCDDYCQTLEHVLAASGKEVRRITLRDLDIADCIGCYSCWVKTPGICALKDDQEEILKGYVWADWVILASPVIMGFVSSLIKKVHDRLIPLVHPFLRLEQNRMSHYPRYDSTAEVGLILEQPENNHAEDLEIINKVYGRAAFTYTMQRPVEEVAHEIDHL